MGPGLGPHFLYEQRLMDLSRIDLASIGHIHQDTVSGFVDTQCFAFLVDVRNHQARHFMGIGGKSPFAHALIYEHGTLLIFFSSGHTGWSVTLQPAFQFIRRR